MAPKPNQQADKGLADMAAEFEESDNTSFLNYLEAKGSKDIDPLSAQGLRLQADYVKSLGEHAHPFDVLNRIMKNPFADPKDRISSAKTLLEYSHRKVPANIEVSGTDGGPIKLDATALKALSTEELGTLLSLLDKAKPAAKD